MVLMTTTTFDAVGVVGASVAECAVVVTISLLAGTGSVVVVTSVNVVGMSVAVEAMLSSRELYSFSLLRWPSLISDRELVMVERAVATPGISNEAGSCGTPSTGAVNGIKCGGKVVVVGVVPVSLVVAVVVVVGVVVGGVVDDGVARLVAPPSSASVTRTSVA